MIRGRHLEKILYKETYVKYIIIKTGSGDVFVIEVEKYEYYIDDGSVMFIYEKRENGNLLRAEISLDHVEYIHFYDKRPKYDNLYPNTLIWDMEGREEEILESINGEKVNEADYR